MSSPIVNALAEATLAGSLLVTPCHSLQTMENGSKPHEFAPYADELTGAIHALERSNAKRDELEFELDDIRSEREALERELKDILEENRQLRIEIDNLKEEIKDGSDIRSNSGINGSGDGDADNRDRSDRYSMDDYEHNGGRDSEVEEAEASVQTQAQSQTIQVEATTYTAKCNGCSGVTKSGVDVSDTVYYEGKRVIATDPAVIPTGSTVLVTLESGARFEATAQDVGGAIKGNRIDVLVSSKEEATQFGRQKAEVELIY